MTAASSLAAFVDGLEALDVAGVARRFAEGPPVALNRNDLPAQFVMTPEPASNEQGWVFGQSGWQRVLRAEVVIVLEALGQNSYPQNHRRAVDMVDHLNTALESDTVHDLVVDWPAWSVRLDQWPMGGAGYWALVATIQGLGRVVRPAILGPSLDFSKASNSMYLGAV